MRKTKHNALDENAVYGAPIWKSEGVNRSRLIDGCNEKWRCSLLLVVDLLLYLKTFL